MEKPVTQEPLDALQGHIQHEIAASAVELLAGDYRADTLAPYGFRMTRELIAAHRRAQAARPPTTDCDRLDAAFAARERSGVVCSRIEPRKRSAAVSQISRSALSGAGNTGEPGVAAAGRGRHDRAPCSDRL